MPNDKIIKPKTIEEIRKSFETSLTGYDSNYILRKADEERIKSDKPTAYTPESAYYKAMSLFEFDKGVLLLNAVPNLHNVFALDFCKNIQAEYKCETPSQKSLAEVVALNFVRVLAIQTKITTYLSKDSVTDIGVNYLRVMSQELDRAQRHYLASLEALRTLHSPSFNVNIKTNTAVIGQTQAVQVKNT